jgi:hypothetical protein
MKFNSFRELDSQILAVVKSKADSEPLFEGIVIRRRYVPKNDDAVKFLGGFGQGTEIDLENSFGVSHVINGVWYPQDCYTLAVSNIEGAAFALNRRIGPCSSSLPNEYAGRHQTNDAGAVAFDIYETLEDGTQVHFLRIFVSVANVLRSEDINVLCESAAWAAKDVFRRWKGVYKYIPFFDE